MRWPKSLNAVIRGRFSTAAKIPSRSTRVSVSFSQQRGGQVVQDVAVGVEDLPGLGVRRLDERAHLLVDLVRDLERVVGLVAHRPAEERVALLAAVA